MKILFIRHAEAVESEEWNGDDLGRPLTASGRAVAKGMARLMKKIGVQPGIVICSEAVRARQTAKYFVGGKKGARISQLLNPGCSTAGLRRLLREHGKEELIAVAGHEPDFSTIITELIGNGTARVKMSKGACALVEMGNGRGLLRWLLPPLPGLVEPARN